MEGLYGVPVWGEAVEPWLPIDFPDAAHRPSSRDLPSLDGLRALSIGFVLLGHASRSVPPIVETLLARLAHFGVCVFFVISGYLITSLLWRDVQKRGELQLGRFYLRRTLRIFPPFYVYLTVVAVGVAVAGWPTPANTRWWPAFTYLSNFANTNWSVTGHSWSLSLEEQFYLTWPVALAACIRARGAEGGARLGYRVAAAALIVFPLLRVGVFGATRSGILTGTFIFDYVAAGSAIALFIATGTWERGRRVLDGLLKNKATPAAFALAMVLHVTLAGTTRWLFAADAILITPVEAVLLAIFIAWAVRNPKHPVGRVLNLRALRVIGVGSYSLYLWQQLFFGPGAAFALSWSVWLKLTAACACATASYFFVERPSLRLRSRLELALFPGPVDSG
ncbi:MAG TPA: acyltransferase [Gemmatimonadaceae bacterium]|nr:acyltransferase [Gemmatimonadaceae bacterium]